MANKFTSTHKPKAEQPKFAEKFPKNPNVTRDPLASPADLKEWRSTQDTIKKDQEQERIKADQVQEPAKSSKLKDAVAKVKGYFKKPEPTQEKNKTLTPDR